MRPKIFPRCCERSTKATISPAAGARSALDNAITRKIPSRIANWLMAKASGVDLRDFGTTFKAYRAEVLKDVNLYGELHRFIPALASFYGARVAEVPIRNTPRAAGDSHYGLGPHVPRAVRHPHHQVPAEVFHAAHAFLRRDRAGRAPVRRSDPVLPGRSISCSATRSCWSTGR